MSDQTNHDDEAAEPSRPRPTPNPEGRGYQPEPLDLVAFRKEQAREVLSRRIPARFVNARADNPQVARWAAQFVADPTGARSLLISGPTGTGKTHQCWGAIRAIVEGLATQGRSLDWRATTHPDMNSDLRPKVDGSHHGVLERLMRVDLLMLDDLGAGKSTDWTEDTLYRLIDHRWSNNRPTMFSTNLPPKTLANTVGERIMSRLGDAIKVAITGEDRRWMAA
jgi:DNA replication protein DnaC